MKTYILHYTPLIERKDHINKTINRHNLDGVFIERYDKEDLLCDEIKKFSSQLGLSTISLAKKHFEAWRLATDRHQLILEDDVILDDNFSNKLTAYIRQLPKTYDMLFIGNGCNLHIPHYMLVDGLNVYKKSNYPSLWGGDGATRCADSYLITNTCANKLLNYANDSSIIDLPVDWFMNRVCRELDLEVYWAEPTIVQQGSEVGLFKNSRL